MLISVKVQLLLVEQILNFYYKVIIIVCLSNDNAQGHRPSYCTMGGGGWGGGRG